MCEVVKELVLSICQSVCQYGEKFGNQHIYWVKQLQLLYVTITYLKKNNVCVHDRDQSSSLLCVSSSFLFNIGIVHHFDTINHLDTVETRHMRTPSMCSRSPASSFPGLRKAWMTKFSLLTLKLLGNDVTHSLDLASLMDGWARDNHLTGE